MSVENEKIVSIEEEQNEQLLPVSAIDEDAEDLDEDDVEELDEDDELEQDEDEAGYDLGDGSDGGSAAEGEA